LKYNGQLHGKKRRSQGRSGKFAKKNSDKFQIMASQEEIPWYLKVIDKFFAGKK
jgi:hypothetical protein